MPSQKTEEAKNSTKSHDPVLLSAIAHGSILAVFFLGPLTLLVPLVIWLSERNQPSPSELVLSHARHAFFYQLAVYLIGFTAGIFIALLTLIFIGLLFIPFLILFFVAAVVYGVYGAIQVWQGKPFQYKFISDFVEKKF